MIRPTFLAFETARKAIGINQIGLDTVGHNISNANTPGYTRQRVDQVSISASGYKAKYTTFGLNFSGQGADLQGISQIRDPFLDKRYRAEAATYGEYGVKDNGLTDLNSIFDETTTDGLHAKLDDLIQELIKFASAADSKELGMVVRTTASQLMQILNKNAKDLEAAAAQQKFDLGVAVENDVNSVLQRIANLNVRIKEENFYGNPANELNDERNLLLDQLSQFLDINVIRTPVKISNDLTIEQISVELNNSGDASKGINPIVLVDSGSYNKLKITEDANGKIGVALLDGVSGFTVDGDITGRLYKGGIKGYLDVLNGEGMFATGAGDNSFRGIPYYQKVLDDFAVQFAQTMNELNRIEVLDEIGDSSDPPIYLERPLFVANDGSGVITAKNLNVSTQWLDNPLFIGNTINQGYLQADASGAIMLKDDGSGNPGASTILLSDIKGMDGDGYLLDGSGNRLVKIDDLLRVDEHGTAVQENLPGASANDNILRYKTALQDSSVRYPNGFRGNFQEYIVGFQSEMALDKNLNTSLLKASFTVISSYADSRDAISAVSIDEEAVNMMTYQNAYNAAARYMTVLDEALQKIIEGMGIVGR